VQRVLEKVVKICPIDVTDLLLGLTAFLCSLFLHKGSRLKVMRMTEYLRIDAVNGG
jgi:hypothetical protein